MIDKDNVQTQTNVLIRYNDFFIFYFLLFNITKKIFLHAMIVILGYLMLKHLAVVYKRKNESHIN
jgi:hypothetical protein